MIHLKQFENREEIWNVNREDIKEIFNDFIDEFELIITFGKKLQKSSLSTGPVVFIKPPDIVFGFKPYIQIRLISLDKTSPYRLGQYINSGEFSERKKEINSKLDYNDLFIDKVYIEVNSIIFLIYTKK